MSTQPKTITPRVIIQMLFFIVFIPILPLIISGHWAWWQAWVFAAVSILGFIVSRALLPVILLAVVLIIRTRPEDTTLQNELPGYRKYAARVRFRLLPGLW